MSINVNVAGAAIAVLLYAGAAVMTLGIARRVWLYARTPMRLRIPTTPAPVTRFGVMLRMMREILLFESLFKASRWTWAFGWLFHFALVLALIRHLRYVAEPVWGWVHRLQPLADWSGGLMLIGLGGLAARRVWVDRVRYISTPSDYLMLALLAALCLSGLAVEYIWRVNLFALKQFVLSWLGLHIAPLPGNAALWIHLGLAAVLMMIFPISKLLHAPGVLFSPTRNQADRVRRARAKK